jgi:2-polyprenyl-6-methoxyphenol hydroxylase-like FAD-dependent oxidoreductase
MDYIFEPSKQLPIAAKVDLCVIGGSCTGVFAAVRAARMGLSVALIEKTNALGGTAGNGLVCVWHSLYDTEQKEQVIAGLTYEMTERLAKQNAIITIDARPPAFVFNPEELKIELDALVKEHKIQLFLHTFYTAAFTDGKKVTAVAIENKGGRSAIAADFFIDASGDGDVAKDLSLPSYVPEHPQPPTACWLLQGDLQSVSLSSLLQTYGPEFGLEKDWGWGTSLPGTEEIHMRADTHVFDRFCANAGDLTEAEVAGREQMRRIVRLLNAKGAGEYRLLSACSHIGIRETYHYKTRYQADWKALLTGQRYENAIMNGSYRIDIHLTEERGITFLYLDGRKETFYGRNERKDFSNWREELGLSGPPATYYQVPFDLLVQEQYDNFLAVGRMLNADVESFGALRVMVNLNQLGEAAGVAAALCVDGGVAVQKLDGVAVRSALRKGGSAL